MARFKSLFDLSEKQAESLEEIKIALDCINIELYKQLEYFIDSIMEEAYDNGEREGYENGLESARQDERKRRSQEDYYDY